MGTHTQLVYHIVYSTKHREPTIVQDQKKRLFAYIHHLLTNKKCHLYRINGIEDHIKQEGIFPKFKGWQDGYGAFSESINSKDRLINYVKNQEEHHKNMSFLAEYKVLMVEHEIEFDEKYLI